jgi:hypothetical protein
MSIQFEAVNISPDVKQFRLFRKETTTFSPLDFVLFGIAGTLLVTNNIGFIFSLLLVLLAVKLLMKRGKIKEGKFDLSCKHFMNKPKRIINRSSRNGNTT